MVARASSGCWPERVATGGDAFGCDGLDAALMDVPVVVDEGAPGGQQREGEGHGEGDQAQGHPFSGWRTASVTVDRGSTGPSRTLHIGETSLKHDSESVPTWKWPLSVGRVRRRSEPRCWPPNSPICCWSNPGRHLSTCLSSRIGFAFPLPRSISKPASSHYGAVRLKPNRLNRATLVRVSEPTESCDSGMAGCPVPSRGPTGLRPAGTTRCGGHPPGPHRVGMATGRRGPYQPEAQRFGRPHASSPPAASFGGSHGADHQIPWIHAGAAQRQLVRKLSSD